jgi:hypothetical protein
MVATRLHVLLEFVADWLKSNTCTCCPLCLYVRTGVWRYGQGALQMTHSAIPATGFLQTNAREALNWQFANGNGKL